MVMYADLLGAVVKYVVQYSLQSVDTVGAKKTVR